MIIDKAFNYVVQYHSMEFVTDQYIGVIKKIS